MPEITRFLSLLSLAAMPLTMVPQAPFAQTAGEAQTEQEAPSSDNGLAMGETVDDTPRPGETYVKEEIGDWALRCVVVENAEDRCQLYQLLEDNNGQPIAEFTLLKLPEGGQAQAAATIIVPLETSLQDQLSIRVDEQNGKRYPFAFCNTVGCFARIGLTQEDIDMYKRGSEALLSIVPIAAPDQRVAVSLSLNGFTAAFDKVEMIGQDN